MKITSLHLKNFKRFSDLKLDLSKLLQPPKLVLLIGANGCGKSGVFDAFELLDLRGKRHQGKVRSAISQPSHYYQKNDSESYIGLITDNGGVSVSIPSRNKQNRELRFSHTPAFGSCAFYGRSAIRYLPRLTRTSIGQTLDISQNTDRPQCYIDPDNRFENDIDTLIKTIVDKIFQGLHQSSTDQLDEIRAFLNRINEALPRIFGDESSTSLHLLRFVPPSDGQPNRLIFKKGNSEIDYDLLSSGEKEVVNILFNLFVRSPFYQDTVYFFDELDAHLHTSLQYHLLQEIVEHWIPENCQLWTASHSLGFIQYAQGSEHAAILDFDNLDFDQPQVLLPHKEPEIFHIAVPPDSLAMLFQDKHLIFCENQNAHLFNSMGFNKALFLGDVDKNSVFLRTETKNQLYGLVDRDYLSDLERLQLMKQRPNLFILNYYGFENYLYHPDNLSEVIADFDKEAYLIRIVAEKNRQRDDIISKIRGDRASYLFFKKSEYKLKASDIDPILKMLNSDEFEQFYKVFNMKNKGHLSEVHNLNQGSLSQTQWFKQQLLDLFQPRLLLR